MEDKRRRWRSPRYAYQGDIEDATSPDAPAELPPGVKTLADRALIPKFRVLSLDRSSWPSSAQPAQVAALAQSVLDAYANNGADAFRLEQAGGLLHVVPARVRSVTGAWTSQESIL